MSLFVSVAKDTLNIGENPTQLLNGLVNKFGDTVINDVMQFIQNGKRSKHLKGVDIDELNQIKNFFEQFKNTEDVDMLLKTVNGIPLEGFGWSWSEDIAHSLPVAGSLTLTLGANASAKASILPQPRYVFRGKAGVAGDLQVPFSYGAFSVSGSAKGSAELQATFNHPPTTRILTALVNDLPIVANLTNPKRLINETFESASLKLRGEVNLGAKLTAGRSWVASLGSSGQSAATAEVNVGFQYGIDWARKGAFDIGIQPKRGRLTITLTEDHQGSQQRSLSLGANVKFSGIQEALRPALNRIAGLPKPLQNIVQQYSRPRDLFKRFLTERLESAGTPIQELAKVITGDESATSFVDQLVEEAFQTIDARAERWTAFAEGEVTQLTASILSRINIPQSAKGKLEAVLDEKVLETSQSLSANLQSDLKSALKKKAGTPIVDFLNSIADRTTTALNTTNTTASELLEPVKALLAKYRSFEQSLINAVEVVDKEELGVQFLRTVNRTQAHSTLLEFTLNPSNARAQVLYQQILVGNFRDAMIDGLDTKKSYIKLVSGQFKDIFDRKTTTGLNFNFFGVSLSYQRILSSNLTVKNSVGGDISVFDAKGSARAESVAFGEKEEALISSSLSLVGEMDQPKAPGLAVKLGYSDENLTSQELHNFIQSFVDVGLVAKEATGRMSDGTTTLGIPEDDSSRALQINTQLSLTRGEIEKMAALNDKTVITTAIREQLLALDDTPVNRDYLSGILPQNAQLDPTEDYDLFIATPRSSLIDNLMDRRPVGRQIYTRSQFNFSATLIKKVGDNAQNLAEFLKLWQELVAMPLPKPGSDGRLPDSAVSKFEGKNTQMIDYLDQWAQVPGFIRTELQEEFVSPWALAFLKTLLALSGRKEERLPIYVSWKQDDRMRRIVVM